MTDARAPSRPRRRRGPSAGMLVILTGIGAISWFVYGVQRTWTDMPDPNDPTRAALSALCEAAQPPGEDGWPALAALLEQCHTTAISARNAVPQIAPWEAWERAEATAIRALLDDPRWSARLDAALTMPRHVRPWITRDGLLINEEWRLARPTRALAHGLIEQAEHAATGGAWRDAVASLHRVHRLGTIMVRQPTTFNALIGQSVQRDAMRAVRSLLFDHDVPPEIIAALRTFVERFEEPSTARLFERQRLVLQNALHWTHGARGDVLPLTSLFEPDVLTEGIRLSYPLDPDADDRSFLLALIARWALASHDDSAALADRFFAALTARSDLPFPDRWTDWPPPDLRAALEAPPYAVLAGILPALDRYVDFSDAFVAERRATLIMLALESHGAAHGAFPASLDDLVPASFAAVPTDPLCGGAFGYRLVTDSDGTTTYVLYSLGPDGTDDDRRLDWDNVPAFGRIADGYDIPLSPAVPVSRE